MAVPGPARSLHPRQAALPVQALHAAARRYATAMADVAAAGGAGYQLLVHKRDLALGMGHVLHDRLCRSDCNLEFSSKRRMPAGAFVKQERRRLGQLVLVKALHAAPRFNAASMTNVPAAVSA